MLPRKNRLTQKKDFDSVFKKGETIKSDFLVFKVLKNRLADHRFGFIISKKVSTKATQRNLIKRRLRQSVLVDLKSSSLPEGKKSLDVIIVALPITLRKSFPEIKKTISGFFKKNIH